jgi:two-component system, NarL family, sensor kinase
MFEINNKMKRTIPFLIFIYFCNNFLVLGNVIDSLEKKLPNAEVAEKLVIISDLVWEYSFFDMSKAEKYAKEGLLIAESSNDKKALSQAYNDLGIVYLKKADYVKAENYLLKSLEIRKKLGNKSLIASSTFKLAMINTELGKFENALKYNLETLKLFEDIGEISKIAPTMNNIAALYIRIKQFDKAIEISKKALALLEKTNDDNAFAIAYSNMGDAHERLDDIDKSFEYYFKAIEYYNKTNDKVNLAALYNNIGLNYRHQNKHLLGLEYYQKALKIADELQDFNGYVLYTQNIGNVYVDMGRYNEAEEFFYQALQVAKDRNMKPYERVIYQSLVSLFTKIGEKEKALDFFDAYKAISDTIFSQQLSSSIAQMQTEYETDKKNKEIGLLTKEREIQSLVIEKQNNQRNLLFLAIGIFLIIGYLIFRSYQFQQKELLVKEKLKQEQIRLNAQIMAQEKERRRISEELHDGIGQMLSAVKLNIAAIEGGELNNQKSLETAIKLIDESCNEIRVISHNMMPSALTKAGLLAALNDFAERISNSGKLAVYFLATDDIPKRLEPEIEVNLFRIIQELVNNSIKYSQASEIHIQLSMNENGLAVIVEDNGIGFDKTILQKNNGNGWNNIQSRINIMKANLEIDTSIGKGTAIFIEIPISVTA